MKMILVLAAVFLAGVISSCKGQDKNDLRCEVLSRFVSDSMTLRVCNIEAFSIDTIRIIDSTNVFDRCGTFKSGNKTVVIIRGTNGLNIDPSFRRDLKEWQRSILIHRLDIRKKFQKVHFYYKPTNGVGFIKFNIRRSKIVSVDYSVGQL